MKNIFLITFNVIKGDNSIIPEPLIGAVVTCYVEDVNFENAAERVLDKFLKDGLVIKELIEPVEVLSGSWDEYLSENWSDYKDEFPSQAEFDIDMSLGRIIYGPFIGYETTD